MKEVTEIPIVTIGTDYSIEDIAMCAGVRLEDMNNPTLEATQNIRKYREKVQKHRDKELKPLHPKI